MLEAIREAAPQRVAAGDVTDSSVASETGD
jgi:hypothetical protein